MAAFFLNDMVSLVRESVNYATICAVKAELNKGRKRGDKFTNKHFLALSSGNDPFYADNPTSKKWGEWFAENWKQYKSHLPSVHVRSLHYALIGLARTDTPCIMPNGKVYENTLGCWKELEKAGKYARYNNLLPLDRWEDKRAQSLVELVYEESEAYIGVSNPAEYTLDIKFPSFPRLPTYFTLFRPIQRYRLEVWCEKSTQNDVLVPICEKYQTTLLQAQGELSISAMVKAIRRAERAGMPTRILYISDFDPAGRSMPVAASRKLEFLQGILRTSAEIQLYPIALTHEQCIQYQLDRTPIKDSERRRGKFEDRYGSGATELDALEAQHPGELGRLLEREILRFYDDTLEEQAKEVERRLDNDDDTIQDEIHEEYQGDSLANDYKVLKAEFDEWNTNKWLPFKRRLIEAYHGIETSLRDRIPDIDDYPLPEAKEVPTGDDCLYDSSRGYLQQIAAYNAFTGKFAHLIEEDEDSIE